MEPRIEERLERLLDIQRKLMHHIFWVSYEYDVPHGERQVLQQSDRYTDRRCKLLYAIQEEALRIELGLGLDLDWGF